MRKDEVTVPVLVDAVRDTPAGELVRCLYYCVESVKPSAGWRLDLGGERIPLVFVGFSGVITRPPRRTAFKRPESIDSLFDRIENDDQFSVELGHVWIARESFSENPERGQVYRIPLDLFSAGLLYAEERMPLDKFGHLTMSRGPRLAPSRDETKAFTGWQKEQLERAGRTLPRNPELALRRRKEEGTS
jgi:hypothetical protein